MKKTSIIFPILLLSIASCSVNIESEEQDEVKPDVGFTEDNLYIQGQSYMYLSEELSDLIERDLSENNVITKSPELSNMVESLGITSIRRLFPHAGEYEIRTRKEGLHRWYIVEYSAEIPRTKAEDDLLDVPGVEYVEPVMEIRINDFNDMNSKLWGLDNISNPGFDINIKPVWKNYTTGNPNVIVSVVDSGVDLKHEDLADNCLASGHYNFVDDNNVIVAESHGTHVAGTIAAVSNNGKGVVGIAGGNFDEGKGGVKILSCQILKTGSDGKTMTGNSAAAIKWGADHGAVISQNSWGYVYDADGDGKYNADEMAKAKKAKVTEADRQAIEYFIKYAGCDNDGNQLPGSPMKGGVVIFAAGNESIDNGAPANYESVIAVGAIDSEGQRASFSNYGPWVDLAAPGTKVYSTYPNNSYATSDGTSMACPHVSGVAALLVSYFGGPGFTNDILKEKLLSGSNKEKISSSDQIGGLLDAYGSFVHGQELDVESIDISYAETYSNNLTLKWTIPSDSQGMPAYGAMFIYGKDRDSVENATPSNHSNLNSATYVHTGNIGEEVEFTIPALDFETTYFIKGFAYSYSYIFSESSSTLEVITKGNNSPDITFDYDETFSINSSDKVIVSVEAHDPDGHAVELTYENGSAADSFNQNPNGSYTITFIGNAAPEGTYIAQIIAVDQYGAKTIKPIKYTILGNLPPENINEIPDILLSSKGQEFIIDMGQYVSDPDGEQLRHEVIIEDPSVIHITVKMDQLIGTSLAYGKTNVTVISKDARGETAQANFRILVKDPSDPISVYPNPVVDFVNISTLEESDTEVTIVSQTGKTIYNETIKASAFAPARIDMSNCAPGVYSVYVKLGETEYKEIITKI